MSALTGRRHLGLGPGSPASHSSPVSSGSPIRVAFVVHVMQVAGAEMLVAATIRRLGPRIEPAVFCLDDLGTIGNKLAESGVPIISFGRRPGLDLGVVWCVAREIRLRRIEVVHAHQYGPFFYGALGARLSTRRPRVILTEHGRHYPDVVSPLRRATNRLVLNRLADAVNAVCGFSARALARNEGFADRRIDVIENGIELARYRPDVDRAALRNRLGFDASRCYIVAVARFHPVKDHRTLLRAFQVVAGVRADVDLILAGDGPLRGELESLARELGIAGRTKFLGVRTDVPDLLAAADVFTLTSVSEAASLTLLEAMAAGTPVVTTAVGGSPEIVVHDEHGLLVPRGDAPATAEALLRVLQDPALAARLGAAARQRVEERYRIETTVARYGALYERLARRR